jgi:carbon storage regulator CsrA
VLYGPVRSRIERSGRQSTERVKLVSPEVVTQDASSSKRGVGHLVITRRDEQSVMIGDDIEITILAVLGKAVRIGISAPRSVKVLRTEIYGAEMSTP